MAKVVLTDKQEAFAVAYVLTANSAEAYRQAYDVPKDARDGWIYVESCQLLDHPKVGPRIKELNEAAKKRSEYTVTKAIEELEEARSGAMMTDKPAAAVSAVMGKVKILGLDSPARVDHTSSDGTMTPQAATPIDATLVQALVDKLTS